MFNNLFIAFINHLLSKSPSYRQRLLRFSGKSARMTTDIHVLDFSVAPSGYFTMAECAQDVDVDIRLRLLSPATFSNLSSVLSQSHVSGNVEFATELSFLFNNIQWDYEEDLASIFGDVVAHRAAKAISTCVSLPSKLIASILGNTSEYICIENRMLARRDELSVHVTQLKLFMSDLEQIEKHVDSFRNI